MIKRFINYMKGWRNVYRLIKLQRELQRFANEPKQSRKEVKNGK